MPDTPPSRNIRLLVAYDGTGFSGWQRQECRTAGAGRSGPAAGNRGGVRTVQGEIEAALEKIHRHPVILTGSGRTDAGVHAAGQVANFHTDIKNMPPERFVPALNTFLPQEIRILEAAETRRDFHARFDARLRTYRYHFVCGRRALPHESRYSLQLWRHPNPELLNAYGRLLLGERDCSLFAGAGDRSASRSRYISGAVFFVEGGRLVFEISANAFLWKMVRSVAGTFLYYEERKTPPGDLAAVIASGNRGLAGPTLPPRGLFLWKVGFFREQER
ncbi:MAG: tRNA pseudouridine synthase A [Treponema sp.]|jgi:tRNA pseudouridine38-40 synthase|nr:tRNA pseudouridine synthase A [Treponema sp.]